LNVLSQQKLKWNNEIYDQLTALGRQFSGILSQSYADAKRKSEHISELIGRAKAALQQGRKEAPFKLYSEIQEIFNSIPNAFFEEKRLVEAQVSDFYKELKSTTDYELLKRVSGLITEISQLIDRINIAIRAKDMINATVNYNKCIEFYNQIPEGFLRHKNLLGMRLLDMYRSLSIYNEISSLQRQLVQQPQFQQAQVPQIQNQTPMTAGAKKERAKKNIEKGFYNEASKDIQEALHLDPNDAEAKALHAKIKTLQ
jgi:tetratricopeptide (TPR) repeat protein